MSFMKRLFKKLLLLVGGLIVGCVLAELIVRPFSAGMILYPRYHTGAMYGESKLRRLTPNTTFWHTSIDGTWQFRTNSQGFRSDHDFYYDKPAGVVRVLALGDSTTQGFEVRQEFTYAESLERWLRHHQVQAEVLNTGVSGFGTAEELVFLENEGYKYQPDYVVLGFFSNDYQDSVKSGLFELVDNQLVERSRTYQPGVRVQDILYSLPGPKWLGENSYAYSLLFNGAWDFAKRWELRRAREEFADDDVFRTSGPEMILGLDETPAEIDFAIALIKRMQEFCRTKGIRLIVLDIPSDDDQVDYSFDPSISPGMYERLKDTCDYLITSEVALDEYRGVAEFHVPHGQHHISEFTHLRLARILGTIILEDRK